MLTADDAALAALANALRADGLLVQEQQEAPLTGTRWFLRVSDPQLEGMAVNVWVRDGIDVCAGRSTMVGVVSQEPGPLDDCRIRIREILAKRAARRDQMP